MLARFRYQMIERGYASQGECWLSMTRRMNSERGLCGWRLERSLTAR
jgi:hypothetical protein